MSENRSTGSLIPKIYDSEKLITAINTPDEHRGEEITPSPLQQCEFDRN
jgi:hypothetical protein